jgi:hypothetical protein
VIKGLKIVMIVWPALSILMGLGFLFFPAQISDSMGFGKSPDNSVLSLLATLGVLIIVASVFVIIAARDPLKHLLWVRYVTTFAILDTVVKAYTIVRGYVTFKQIGLPLIVDAIFAVALLALYPWRENTRVKQD